MIRKAAAFSPARRRQARLCRGRLSPPTRRRRHNRLRFAPYRLRVLSLGFQLLRTHQSAPRPWRAQSLYFSPAALPASPRSGFASVRSAASAWPLTAAQTRMAMRFSAPRAKSKRFPSTPVALHPAHQLSRSATSSCASLQAYFPSFSAATSIFPVRPAARARRAVRA